MAKEAFSFSGEDAQNYETFLGPLLFEPAALSILTHLGSNKIETILEISSGTGRLTRHLREYFHPPAKLTASDISKDMLELAKKQLNDNSIIFKVADAQNLPFEDGSFDLVVCQFGLMFLSEKLKGFREVFRVLKDGGRFIFNTWESTKNVELFNIVFEETIIPFFDGTDTSRFRTPFSLFDPGIINRYLEDAGFKRGKVIPIEFASYSSSPENIINALLLKHPLGREVAQKDPDALNAMAEALRKRLIDRFGESDLKLILKSLIGTGFK
jgi:ubiquinone/menaquinone biosynthesis C-methylase UbiE